MPEVQSSISLKRKRSDKDNSTDTESRKEKKWFAPPWFWDNLSKLCLTRRALIEQNRRAQKSNPLTCAFLQEYSDLEDGIEYLSNRDHQELQRIKAFARHGGPDLTDLRHCPPLPLPSLKMDRGSTSRSPFHAQRALSRAGYSASDANLASPEPSSVKTQSTGAYNRDFEQHLIDHQVFPDGALYGDDTEPALPNGWEELQTRITQRRRSLSPSEFTEEKFRHFKRNYKSAGKEKQVSESVLPMIEGDYSGDSCRGGGIPFNNLLPLTDGWLKPGNPDIYHGARPVLIEREVRLDKSGHIEPSTQSNLPAAPNFFVAVKGPDGNPAVVERQACYDGALGARGMQSLLSYDLEVPTYDNKARTITVTFCAGMLQIFTSHVAKSKTTRKEEYLMHQVDAWAMVGNAASFREGATAYRNARDWAKEKRNEVIAIANERARGEGSSAGPSGTSGREDSGWDTETPKRPRSMVDDGSKKKGRSESTTFTNVRGDTSIKLNRCYKCTDHLASCAISNTPCSYIDITRNHLQQSVSRFPTTWSVQDAPYAIPVHHNPLTIAHVRSGPYVLHSTS